MRIQQLPHFIRRSDPGVAIKKSVRTKRFINKTVCNTIPKANQTIGRLLRLVAGEPGIFQLPITPYIELTLETNFITRDPAERTRINPSKLKYNVLNIHKSLGERPPQSVADSTTNKICYLSFDNVRPRYGTLIINFVGEDSHEAESPLLRVRCLCATG